MRSGNVEALENRRPDPLVDRHRVQLFSGETCFHFRIDSGEPCIDHIGRAFGKGELCCRRINAGIRCGPLDRLVAPAVERRMAGNGRPEMGADFIESRIGGDRLGHSALYKGLAWETKACVLPFVTDSRLFGIEPRNGLGTGSPKQ